MSNCGIGARCHVAGQGIGTFGTKFPQATVLQLASSSVLLIDSGTSNHIASGVLIAQNVLLCAVHSITSVSTANLRGLLLFECDAKTAPGFTPSKSAFAKPPPPPPPCTPLATAAQFKLDRELENGKAQGLDYALFAISWLTTKVSFPRKVTLPRPDYFYGGELVAIGHPVMSSKAEPTQAAAGKHIATAMHGPHPVPSSTAESQAKEYTYADFYTTDGMSGGGVFNEKGSLVGIVTGYRTSNGVKEFGFLNLGLVAGKTVSSGNATAPASERVKKWMGGGLPLLSSDPQPPTGVSFSPSL